MLGRSRASSRARIPTALRVETRARAPASGPGGAPRRRSTAAAPSAAGGFSPPHARAVRALRGSAAFATVPLYVEATGSAVAPPRPRPESSAPPLAADRDRPRGDQPVVGSLAEHYRVGSELGRGAFGVVRLATDRACGSERAVKTVENGEEERHEAAMLARVMREGGPSPHVMRLRAVYEERERLHLVSDVYRGGELFDHILEYDAAGASGMPEGVAAGVVAQMAAAVRHCHGAGVAHLDLKPENFMLREPRAVATDGAATGGHSKFAGGLRLATASEPRRACEPAGLEPRGAFEPAESEPAESERPAPPEVTLVDFGMAQALPPEDGAEAAEERADAGVFGALLRGGRARRVEAALASVRPEGAARDAPSSPRPPPRLAALAGPTGSVTYCAPEVLRGYFSRASDMWSLGVVAYVLLTGHTPWPQGQEQRQAADIVAGRFDLGSDAFLARSDEARALVEGLLRLDHRERLTAEEVLAHPFVRGVSGRSVSGRSVSGCESAGAVGGGAGRETQRAGEGSAAGG
jgi:serine/threonine protein kinase